MKRKRNEGIGKLTIEKFRAYPGCDKYSEKEAAEIVRSLEELAAILVRNLEYNNRNNYE